MVDAESTWLTKQLGMQIGEYAGIFIGSEYQNRVRIVAVNQSKNGGQLNPSYTMKVKLALSNRY